MTTISEHGGSPDPRGGQPAASQAGQWAVKAHGLTQRSGTRDRRRQRGPARPAWLHVRDARKRDRAAIGSGQGGQDPDQRGLARPVRPEAAVRSQLSRALAQVGAIANEPRFHGHLTGRENLKILAAARGREAEKQIGPALDRTGLTQRADDKVSAYQPLRRA